jgi:hypothetical protein
MYDAEVIDCVQQYLALLTDPPHSGNSDRISAMDRHQLKPEEVINEPDSAACPVDPG